MNESTSSSKKTSEFYRSVSSTLTDQYLFGHRGLIDLMFTAFLARGHILIEGPPGTGKTLTAKLLAKLFAKSFKRIQFTTDMLPSDILGSSIYSPGSQTFKFVPGPIFADLIIADEINRTPPRTQSALLEAMEERQVTVEGATHPLAEDFFVVATQNPQDHEGTFPLPEVQMDRFLFKIVVDHADSATEVQILKGIMEGKLPPDYERLKPLIFDRDQMDREIQSVRIDTSLLEYISKILVQTRTHPMLAGGSSVRGGIALARCSRIYALVQGREFVIPDDIKTLSLPILRHRIRLNPESRFSGVTEGEVIGEILKKVDFPK